MPFCAANSRDPEALLERLKREAALRSVSRGETERSRARLPTGLAGLDEAIGGGLPRGRIVELIGDRSSGRTGLLLSMLASATGLGERAALVDPLDSFDPEAAAAAGVTLERLLWIRTRNIRETLRAADLVLDAGGFGVAAIDIDRRTLAGTDPARFPWARLSLRSERSGTVLVALGDRRLAGTFTSLAIGCSRVRAQWTGSNDSPLLDRIESRFEILKARGEGTAGRPRRWTARSDAA